jgi:cellulose biosynthesis protein BcsQ
MTVVAVYNLKGGVGKTTAAVNLSYLAAAEGTKTLLVDLDPQGSASYYFRVRPRRKLTAATLVKGGKRLDAAIRGSDFENLDILPADISFRNLSATLGEKKKPRARLRRVFKRFRNEYKLIIVDCPPDISLEAESIFRAANLIVMPVIPTPLSMETKRVVMRFLEKKRIPSIPVVSFFSMVDRRKSLHREIVDRAAQNGPGFTETVIPYSAPIERMGVLRRPICATSSKSSGSLAFKSLWGELKARIESRL